MIATQISGGLGNQMFQYATARSLAAKHEAEVRLDLSWFDQTNNQEGSRFFELECFNFKQRSMDPSRYLLVPHAYGRKGRILLRLGKPFKKKLNHYQEAHYYLNEPVLQAPDNSYLAGHWTTEKYFNDQRGTILNDFTWTSQLYEDSKKVLDNITSSETPVGVHVRRGDYVSSPTTNKYHGVMDIGYYHQAENILKKKFGKLQLFIFSDDQAWVKRNLKPTSTTSYVEINKKGSDDMRLLKECKHFVIANSTFSWWAAWLGQDPQKTVVAPKQWAQTTAIDTRDVVPKDWLRI